MESRQIASWPTRTRTRTSGILTGRPGSGPPLLSIPRSPSPPGRVCHRVSYGSREAGPEPQTGRSHQPFVPVYVCTCARARERRPPDNCSGMEHVRDGERRDLLCIRRICGAAIPSINNTGAVLGEREIKKYIQKKGSGGKINPLDIRRRRSAPLSFLYQAQIISLHESRAQTPFFKADKHIECKLPKLHRK